MIKFFSRKLFLARNLKLFLHSFEKIFNFLKNKRLKNCLYRPIQGQFVLCSERSSRRTVEHFYKTLIIGFSVLKMIFYFSSSYAVLELILAAKRKTQKWKKRDKNSGPGKIFLPGPGEFQSGISEPSNFQPGSFFTIFLIFRFFNTSFEFLKLSTLFVNAFLILFAKIMFYWPMSSTVVFILLVYSF